DITTKPGLDTWRGSSNLGLRDDVLSAKNAFAPVKADERNSRIGFSLNGPLWKRHTSLALSIDGTDAYDTRTIVGVKPGGYYNDSVRKPSTALNGSARVEHMLSKTQMLRAEAQRNHNTAGNLGVGDFDLQQRAYNQLRNEDLFRASVAGSVRKA